MRANFTTQRLAIAFVAALSFVTASAQAKSVSAARNSSASLTTSLSPLTPPEKKKTEIKWRLFVANLDVQTKTDHANQTAFMADSKFRHDVNEQLLVSAWVYAGWRSGYVHSRFGEIQPKNSIGAFHGYFQYTPVTPISVRAGLLDQADWNISVLFDQLPFPGVLEKVKIGEEYSIELRAQQAIATSQFVNATTKTPETQSGFTIEDVKLAAEPKGSLLSASVFGGHWAFQNLTMKAAGDSDVHGNTVEETPSGGLRYKFEFEGWHAGGESKLSFSDSFKFGVRGHMVENVRAPEGYNRGQMAGGEFNIKAFNVDFNPTFDYFFVESDLGPGVYSLFDIGHNNRQGVMGTLATVFNDAKFKVKAIYVDADVINPNPLQLRQQIYFLRIETLYGIL